MRYYEISADILEDRPALLNWTRKALEAALRDAGGAGKKAGRAAGKRPSARKKMRHPPAKTGR